jgi:hypothetical protein
MIQKVNPRKNSLQFDFCKFKLKAVFVVKILKIILLKEGRKSSGSRLKIILLLIRT